MLPKILSHGHLLSVFLLGLTSISVPLPAQKYTGPVPPIADVPFLQHADNLTPTESALAKQIEGRGETVYVIDGPSSKARTPLAEPIFLIRTERIVPEKLELYRLEVKNGRREVVFKKKKSPRPIRISVIRLDDRLYKVEASEYLENGEYALTPAESNQVFCFQIY